VDVLEVDGRPALPDTADLETDGTGHGESSRGGGLTPAAVTGSGSAAESGDWSRRGRGPDDSDGRRATFQGGAPGIDNVSLRGAPDADG
jgi:hypothetical protein